MPDQQNIDEALKEQFKKLPQVVQDAITSANVDKHLRDLSNTHKLHLDQWEKLENEVMLTLLGIQRFEDLHANIRNEVGVSDDVAGALAESIGQEIFEPIRIELERGLEHPEAQAKAVSDIEAARDQELAGAEAQQSSTPAAAPTPAQTPSAPVITPATPPQPKPDVKVTRPSESTAYKPGEASAARKTVVDDPYREPLS